MHIPLLSSYTRWLHTMYPAGTVERLPEVREDGSTRIPGLYVVGDLKSIPLLKFSADSGARAVDAIITSGILKKSSAAEGAVDLVVIGAGVSGISAALRARKRGLSFRVIESSSAFSTIVNFPKAKPIYTYPKAFQPDSELQTTGAVKESLLEELVQQVREAGIAVEEGVSAERIVRRDGHLVVELRQGTPLRARAVIVAIGRSGNYRKLGIPGEGLDKVSNRLHDPSAYNGKRVLVIGGGDSALETAIAIAGSGGEVTLSYRKETFSRPKPENVERIGDLSQRPGAGGVRLLLNSQPLRIDSDSVLLKDTTAGSEMSVANDAVFVMTGREAPLDFFRKSGVPINGEWNPWRIATFVLFLLFCVWLYQWKSGFGYFSDLFYQKGWFPNNLHTGEGGLLAGLSESLKAAINDKKTLLGTLAISMSGASFYYTLAYSLCVTIFGIARIRRRRTPYVTVQTLTLIVIQLFPLFLLPEVILPYFGNNGAFDGGLLHTIANGLFPEVEYGHGREYWRAYGLILAWPLMIYNIFTQEPLWWWIIIGSIQTFVLIPAMIFFWGKGAYCGWICSCGALAETLGDTHRHKMPHGPFWNRLNMTGQVILCAAFIALGVQVYLWGNPDSALRSWFDSLVMGSSYDAEGNYRVNWLSYKGIVDISIAGIIGVGFYFWYSGRVWCRFACPLAALMHIYAKWSRFRIIADKKKCISCNVCTSVCHQGIDIMNFANKGAPMSDPECVRCSACVQSCPTGVLQFGQVNAQGEVIATDSLAASPVLMREGNATQ